MLHVPLCYTNNIILDVYKKRFVNFSYIKFTITHTHARARTHARTHTHRHARAHAPPIQKSTDKLINRLANKNGWMPVSAKLAVRLTVLQSDSITFCWLLAGRVRSVSIYVCPCNSSKCGSRGGGTGGPDPLPPLDPHLLTNYMGFYRE